MKSLVTLLIIIAGMASCKTVQPENNCTGTPTVDCICTKEYLPVCGCDGKTYGNACEARCAGVKTWKEGECNK